MGEAPEAKAPVTAMIFTLNEAIHLPSCLDALAWCDDIVVVDSFSTDSTEAICREHGARFFQNRFVGFGTQRNWALENTEPKHSWILILDADERVTPELARELAQIARNAPDSVGAWRVRRRFYMWGRWLRHSSLYPTWVVRFIHRDRVRYVDRGHAETQAVEGEVRDLKHDLIDENLKGIDEWFARQNRYSRKDLEYELEQASSPFEWRDLVCTDPLRRRAALKRLAGHLPARGLAYFLYSYIWRLGFLDGRDGFVFCRMRALYQTELAIKRYDHFRRRTQSRPESSS